MENFLNIPWNTLHLRCTGEGKIGRQKSYHNLTKLLVTESECRFAFTDLHKLWVEEISAEKCLLRCKELNPKVEADSTELMQFLHKSIPQCLDNTPSMTEIIEKSATSLQLSTAADLKGLSFLWTFYLSVDNSDMFYEHVTRPSLMITRQILWEKEQFMKLLKAKDKEIDDYKQQGVRVKRKHLQTQEFDEVEFSATKTAVKALDDIASTDCSQILYTEPIQSLYQKLMSRGQILKDSNEEAEKPMDPSTGLNINEKSASATSAVNVTPKTNLVKPEVLPDTSPAKDTEKLRREALEQKLAAEEKKLEKKRQKKKMKL